MGKVANITIYNQIGLFDEDDFDTYDLINLDRVRNQYQWQSMDGEVDEIIVRLNSFGGNLNEAFNIYDYLKTLGKPINTIIEGMCYSSATILLLLGKERAMWENSKVGIHNPSGAASGGAKDFAGYAEQLLAAETKMLDFYVTMTGGDKDKIKELMDADTEMSSDQAFELGFVNKVIKTISIAALFNPKDENSKKINIMNKSVEKVEKNQNLIIQALNKLLPEGFKIKMDGEDIVDSKGTACVADDKSEHTILHGKKESPMPGHKVVSADGHASPDGKYDIMDSEKKDTGNDATVKGGVVEKVEKGAVAAPVEPDSDDVMALKAEVEKQKIEIEALKAKDIEITALKAEKLEIENKFEIMNKKQMEILASIESADLVIGNKGEGGKVVKFEKKELTKEEIAANKKRLEDKRAEIK